MQVNSLNMKAQTGFRLVPKPVTLNTLNGVMIADARYLCGSRAYLCVCVFFWFVFCVMSCLLA